MKTPSYQSYIIILIGLIIWGMFSLVGAQYYYFDAASTANYPYQQWCSETLLVKATTDTNANWATAGLLRLLFDPIHFSYYTWDLANGLQTYLFNASTFTFFDYTNPLMSPIWIAGSNKTILWIDRYKSWTPFKGDGIYGTLLFTPVFNPNEYTGTFAIIYNGDTIMTSLSYAWSNIINSSQQNAHLTWYFYVYQQPCVNDTTAPAPTLAIPTAGTKKSYLSGIQLSLTENVGDTNVPYIRTGGLPNVGTWTGNTRGINNQYGVNLSTFNIRISGNGTGRYYSWWMFSPAGTLAAVPSIKTRQFRDKNYAITIDSSKLFDYGIEKPITITGNIRDRNNNISSFSRTINAPFQPWLIVGSDSPAANASAIVTSAPINLSIADDRAGVNSWSITITLSGINGTAYGPYTFTGTSLNLSWLAGSALQPDYAISISSHVAFPSSWTIQVNVYATDMAGNIDTINDYTFTTKPSCQDLWCCGDIYVQTGMNVPFLYTPSALYVSWWLNPSFTINGNTWTIDCNTANQGMNIYKGTEDSSWTATYVSFFDLPNFVLSWYNTVKAVLSWHTLYLQSSHMFNFVVKAFPSNRVYQDTNNSNIWVLKFYDMNRNFVATSLPFNLDTMGTWSVAVNNLPPGTYYAIFKWQSHLASYLSGVTITLSWNILLDFTTWTNLYGAQNLDAQTDNGIKYQTAGDLKPTSGDYDYTINGNDISIILPSFPQSWVSVLDPRNLNGDSEINSSDIGIIGTNFLQEDPFLVNGGLFIWQ